MEKKHLLNTDVVTNIFTCYPGGALPQKVHRFIEPVLQFSPKISIISKVQLRSRARLSFPPVNALDQFIKASRISGLVDCLVNKAIFKRTYFKKVKLPAVILTASCVHHSDTFVTPNVADFTRIYHLKSINHLISNA